MIELEKVCRSFPLGDERVHALVDVDEQIREGEHVAIMGPSGSGKSTLLNILGCLDKPSSGIYKLDGREVGGLDEEELTDVRRHQIGFVFQFFHLVPRLTALENVELPMVFAGISPAERRERAMQAMTRVDMNERVGHRPDQLSGGERQRVAIARATVMGPRLLLADEPTGNLDSVSGRQVLDLLEGMNHRGLTLIVVTHDPAVARRADRGLVMTDGKIVRRLEKSDLAALAGIADAAEVSP
ncbi:MAG: ABC transporter ATP-binding protein [Acidobacteria bacterium]|nr:MAG: ABC transporter ATP-binding protein [Acidobacteriota bacterium]